MNYCRCFNFRHITLTYLGLCFTVSHYHVIHVMVCFFVAKGKQDSAESSEPPMSEAIIPTLPDVKMCAAKAIARSARSGRSLNSYV